MAKKLAPFSALQKAKDYIDRMLSGKLNKIASPMYILHGDGSYSIKRFLVIDCSNADKYAGITTSIRFGARSNTQSYRTLNISSSGDGYDPLLNIEVKVETGHYELDPRFYVYKINSSTLHVYVDYTYGHGIWGKLDIFAIESSEPVSISVEGVNSIPTGAIQAYICNDYTDADKEKLEELDTRGTQTATGNPITITDAEPMNAESVKVELEPKQDSHGYDKPWAGGAGKNKLPLVLADIKTANTSGTWSGNTYTLNGVTFEVLTDSADNVEGIKVNGMASEWTTLNLDMYTFEVGNYIFSNSEDIPNGQYVTITDVGALSVNARTLNVTISESETHNIYIGIDAGIQTNNTIYHPMIRLSTESDPTFEPYSNICPISGYSEVNVENNTDTYTVSLGGTKYGGVLDVTEGGYSDEWGYKAYASADVGLFNGSFQGVTFAIVPKMSDSTTYGRYAFEDLICDRFEYVDSARPLENSVGCIFSNADEYYYLVGLPEGTTLQEAQSLIDGMQLVYELATPTSVSTTPTDIPLLENTNNISSDGTNIQLKYQPNNVIGECKAYTDDKVDTKVDKVNGKGLSTNDYTTAEKDKLAGIANGAEANVQSDWNQSNTTADDFIKNKPTSMPASDVYPWAKAATKPSYSASEVGLGNVGNFKAVSTVASQGLSDTEKTNARNNIGAASNALATTTVKGLMSPDDKNTLNVLNARHKIRVISAQNSYNSSTGISTVTFTLNPPSDLDGWGKFYRVSSMDSTGFGCLFTLHCFAGGLNIANDKLTPNCTMTTSGSPVTGLAVTLVSTEGVGYSGQFRVKVETVNY